MTNGGVANYYHYILVSALCILVVVYNLIQGDPSHFPNSRVLVKRENTDITVHNIIHTYLYTVQY